MNTAKRSVTIKVDPKQPVFTDKKTGVKTIALNFDFPDFFKGIVSVTKLIKLPWLPSNDIESITINFKDHDESKTA